MPIIPDWSRFRKIGYFTPKWDFSKPLFIINFALKNKL